ncbi:oxidoreductase, NAD-binding Rossmann fold family protein [Lactobacillus selangorensis]|uniref:Oxidoreductase, NAD-binding Rossmann fold family protein n=1 Tax=Lactobacillus selangorensis TaxID=81857 RepID=A0A0R2FTX5_9LACO|nr:Gfo/Idh/MocA family oxidoreductase [Lactobacillus selangorensis]KRN28324.1 oxidoreductase, NAD-binding Rossmann fold family protein [Lactobacillus selangorensis]KRN31826.1 oxidoreductase, NAD-binding Rossmann fold family protein [Lactobacillus selangorensis]
MRTLGTIGTGWITGQFVQAAMETNAFTWKAVYSRSADKGRKFAADNQGQDVDVYSNLDEFMQGDFDTVYIASPNSLHFEQAKQAILAGKNVVVEKPAFTNPAEMDAIVALLKQHPEQYLFEAARHIYEDNFDQIQQIITNADHIDGATLTYMKYSSRYDLVLAGEEPNIFSPQFAGGALQDLGVYLVYDAVRWFGVPEKVLYKPTMLRTGVDGKGTAILHYLGFDVTLIMGKTVQSYLPSEIYSGKNTIWTNNAGTFDEVRLYENNGETHQTVGTKPDKNPMDAEVRAFSAIMADKNGQKYLNLLNLSRQVNQVLYDLRQSAGIVFPQDEQEMGK